MSLSLIVTVYKEGEIYHTVVAAARIQLKRVYLQERMIQNQHWGNACYTALLLAKCCECVQ